MTSPLRIASKELKLLFSGVVNNDLDLNYGSGVSPTAGCGVTLRGQFWYFGGSGSQYKRQVSFIAMISKVIK